MKTTKLWVAMAAAALFGLADAKAQIWAIPTNGNTVGSTDYIGIHGTGTYQDVIFKTGSTPSEAFRITSTGSLLSNGTSGTTPTSGSGTRLMWVPAKAAFRAGAVTSTEWDDSNIGSYSAAFGYANKCSSAYSFAAGESNIITGPTSFALGYANSVTSGYYSGAFGYNNTVTGGQSVAFGNTCTSSGGYSLAEGYNAIAGGTVSVAMGGYVQATATSSITLGSGAGTSPLVNSTANSLAVGFNSTSPAFTVTGGGTSSTVNVANAFTVVGTSTLTGNVGINTTPGTYKLAVTGTTNLNGSVTIPGTNTLSVGGATSIGGATIPTGTVNSFPVSPSYNNGIDGTTYNSQYTMALQGNANFQGAVVIGGSPAYFAQVGNSLPYGPWTTDAFYSLFVAGGIITEQVQVAVANSAFWADFVFDKDYKLAPLAELESFIKKNHHLPEIPSADEVVKSGINLAKMDAKLLQKIEELTLYMIDMKKDNDTLKERVKLLEGEKASKVEVK